MADSDDLFSEMIETLEAARLAVHDEMDHLERAEPDVERLLSLKCSLLSLEGQVWALLETMSKQNAYMSQIVAAQVLEAFFRQALNRVGAKLDNAPLGRGEDRAPGA